MVNLILLGESIVIIFGQQDATLEYKKRRGAYGVIKNSDERYLVIKDEDGNFYLIGGEIEEGEEPAEALSREAIEETGYKIRINELIGTAEKHWVSEKYPDWSQHNIGVFYKCDLLEQITLPIEVEPMLWVTLNDLEQHLFHEHQLYMVKKTLE